MDMADTKINVPLNLTFINLPSYGLVKNEEIQVECKQKGLEIFDFTIGDPKEPTIAGIRDALIAHITDVSQYPSNQGLVRLRESAAGWLNRRFGVNASAKTEIISSNGSKEAIFHVPQIFVNQTEQRNVIVFSEPAYPVYRSGTILAGGQPCEVPLKQEKNYIFDVKDIPTDVLHKVAAIWVCYPHNPTGALITHEAAEKLYHWALQNNVILLSDECYTDTYFDENSRPLSFLQIAEKERYKNLLCFFSLSKRSGMTGYRTGFVCGDASLISLFSKYRSHVGLGTPDFVQHAAIFAWNDDAHVKKRNQVFYEKRKILEEFLIKNNIEFLPSNATIYLWAQIPKTFFCARKYCDLLARTSGIFATPGDVFGPHSALYFRLALVPTVAELKKCLPIWQKSIDDGIFL